MSPVSPRFFFAALTLGTVALAGGDFEGPITYKASAVLASALVKGPHYHVAEEVKAEGYFYEMNLVSDYGAFSVEGMALLEKREREVAALARLDDVSKSGVFLEAAGNSVLNVGKSVANVVTDPEGTVKGLGGGLKRFGHNLGRKAKSGADAAGDAVSGDGSKDPNAPKTSTTDEAEAAADSALGVNGAMRRWAQKVGADPYTRNPVLRKALHDIAQIDAAGGIAAKIVVPIPMVVGTTASVGNMVWGKDPQELQKMNEQYLKEMGVDDKVSSAFFKNKVFTPTYDTLFIAGLRASKAEGRAAYVDRASDSRTETEVMFFTQSVAMLHKFEATTPVLAILPDSKALVVKTKDGRAVALVAVDVVRWTEAFAKEAREVAQRAKDDLHTTRVELHLTGRVSSRARSELKAMGWLVTENIPYAVPAIEPPAKKS
jgi:hypothetical protein